MILTAADAYNTPVNMTIQINVNLRPKYNTGVTNLNTTFIALEYSYFEISGGLFTDENTSALVFDLKYINGSSPSSWLTLTPPASPPSGYFNLTGTYPDFIGIDLKLQITATDLVGLTRTVNISITIEAN